MDSLHERMKRYEATEKRTLNRRTYAILRVDGKNFTSYCKGLERPYDLALMGHMDQVAQALVKEISGAEFAFTQSDEVSVLITDFASTTTQPWLGGIVAKMTSISAALATATMNTHRQMLTGKVALFDSRIFTLSDQVEVANYFVYRQNDATRNSIAMSAQAQFAHNRLQRLSTDQLQELLLEEKGISWSEYPDGFRRGRVTHRTTVPKEVTYKKNGVATTKTVQATRLVTAPAPRFKASSGTWLAENIPAMPRL